MKNFLKKAFVCAGVVASAMALSSIAVFAADSVITADTFYDGASTGSEASDATSKFTDNNLTVTLDGKEVYAVYGGLKTATSGSNITNETGKTWAYEFYNTGSSRTITLNAEKSGTITFYYYVSDTGKQIKCGSDSSDKLSAKYTVSSATFNINSGKTTVTWPNKAAFLEMDYTKEAGDEYKITGTQTGLSTDDTFTLKATDGTEYTATVGTDGSSWSVSKTATTSPFANNDTFTVSVDNYNPNPAKVTITGSGTSFTVSDTITFSEIPLQELAAGTYNTEAILAGKPNFDISNTNYNNSKFTTGDSIKFNLSGKAIVTVNVKNGGSKDPSIKLNDDSKEISGDAADYEFTGISGENTLSLVAGSGGKTSAYIYSIIIQYSTETTISSTATKMGNSDYYALDTAENIVYIIHPVKKTDDNYSKADTLVLYSSANEKLDSTTEIYKTIQFAADDTLSINDLSADEDYSNIVGLYAVSKEVESASAVTSASYNWKLETSAE